MDPTLLPVFMSACHRWVRSLRARCGVLGVLVLVMALMLSVAKAALRKGVAVFGPMSGLSFNVAYTYKAEAVAPRSYRYGELSLSSNAWAVDARFKGRVQAHRAWRRIVSVTYDSTFPMNYPGVTPELSAYFLAHNVPPGQRWAPWHTIGIAHYALTF